VTAALGWGVLAASSLVVGAVLGVVRSWSSTAVGLVLGFGAGALISSISFELAAGGFLASGAAPLAVGLAAGAVAFYAADQGVQRIGGRSGGGAAGLSLALGALLDGIPEQTVLGIGTAAGEGVSIALLMAIFVSNLPEAIGSAADMKAAGKPSRTILLGWAAVAAVCALASAAGWAAARVAGQQLEGVVDGFAAGALLVMLVGSMIPEAKDRVQDEAGLAAVLGFALAAGLSAAS
jgi:ZIP family zinc transporter